MAVVFAYGFELGDVGFNRLKVNVALYGEIRGILNLERSGLQYIRYDIQVSASQSFQKAYGFGVGFVYGAPFGLGGLVGVIELERTVEYLVATPGEAHDLLPLVLLVRGEMQTPGMAN